MTDPVREALEAAARTRCPAGSYSAGCMKSCICSDDLKAAYAQNATAAVLAFLKTLREGYLAEHDAAMNNKEYVRATRLTGRAKVLENILSEIESGER
jgi:hypothetical protein